MNQVLIPKTCTSYFTRQKRVFADMITLDLEMESLPWIISLGLKCHYSVFLREAEQGLICRKEKGMWPDWAHAATHQGMPAATTSWKGQGTGSCLKSPEETWPSWHWFWPSASNFRSWVSRTVGETFFVGLSQNCCGNLLEQS